MIDRQYRPLGLGPGSLIGGSYHVARVGTSDPISILLEVHNRGTGKDSLLQLFSPEVTQDQQSVQQLLQELDIARKLEVPGLLPIEHISKTEKQELFVVYEIGKSQSLSQMLDLARGLKFSVEETAYYLWGAAKALQGAVEVGLSHAHISPDVVYVDSNDEVLVRGIGLGKAYRSVYANQSSTIARNFGSPEQKAGHDGVFSCDVYALGLVGYQLRSGRNSEALSLGALEPLKKESMSDPGEWLIDLITQMMDEDLGKRPPSVTAALSVIESRIPPEEIKDSCITARAERKNKIKASAPQLESQVLSAISPKFMLGAALALFLILGIRQLGLKNREVLDGLQNRAPVLVEEQASDGETPTAAEVLAKVIEAEKEENEAAKELGLGRAPGTFAFTQFRAFILKQGEQSETAIVEQLGSDTGLENCLNFSKSTAELCKPAGADIGQLVCPDGIYDMACCFSEYENHCFTFKVTRAGADVSTCCSEEQTLLLGERTVLPCKEQSVENSCDTSDSSESAPIT